MAIESWKDWPADVVDTLLLWNHAQTKRLRFPYTQGFTCSRCHVEHTPNRYGDAVLDGNHVCDNCLIDYVRRFQRFLRRTHGLVVPLRGEDYPSLVAVWDNPEDDEAFG